jgi:hypothetical protein
VGLYALVEAAQVLCCTTVDTSFYREKPILLPSGLEVQAQAHKQQGIPVQTARLTTDQVTYFLQKEVGAVDITLHHAPIATMVQEVDQAEAAVFATPIQRQGGLQHPLMRFLQSRDTR